ncbi:MAG TPA: hypothetical protein VGF50_03140 [Caulobacteraceae bacterium]|jgi:hypothetical protein
MAEISIGAAVGAGFGLIRRRPVSVLVWGAVSVGLQLVALVLFAPFYLAVYGAVIQGAAAGGGTSPMAALQSPQVAAMSGLVQLFNLGQILVTTVVYCAVFRAVLHPERSSFAYLRLGAPEFFFLILIFAAFIGLFVGLLIVILPVSIIIGVTVALTHGAGAAALLLVPLAMVAMIVACIFIGLRFAFVGPMMVDDGKFHLFESWTLTRGRVLSLFLIGLALVGIFILIDLVLLAIAIGAGAAAVQSLGGLGQVAAQLHASPAELLGKLAPLLGAFALLQIPLGGCLTAIAAAPWARAYRDLTADASQVFA